MARGNWKTRFGFYLAAIGSACGLGNLWRFPFVVGDNGGGAFVLLYVLMALVVGLPLMIGELILGRSQRSSVVAATRQLEDKRFAYVGYLSVALSLFLLAYYAVISSWVLFFFVQFLRDVTFNTAVPVSLEQITQNGFLQIGLTSVHLVFCMIVVARGVQEGIERWIGSLIPVFALLLFFLVMQSLSLPTAPDALRFLFYPNFSNLTWSSLGRAIGHVCFTLSVGFGTMVTFGSYMRDDDQIPMMGFRVTLLDTVISIVAGLLIFPIALSISNVPLREPGLLFESLPTFLREKSGGQVFGAAFFLCLYLAALGASIGLFEVIVSNLMYFRRLSRQTATWVAGLFVMVVSGVPALIGALYKGQKGTQVMVLVDTFLVNWLIPVIALGFCWIFARGVSRTEFERSFSQEASLESEALYPHWLNAVRYWIPSLIVLGLALQFVSLFS